MVCLKDDGTETALREVLMLFVINGKISEKICGKREAGKGSSSQD